MRATMRSRWIWLAALALASAPAGVAAAEGPEWPFLDHEAMPHRGRIGVQVQGMTPELREHMAAPADAGVLVTRVEAGRPAARGGLRVGDVIVAAGTARVERPFDLVKAVARVPAGEPLPLRVIREGEEQMLRLEPEGDPSPWIDPDYWRERLERGVREGSEELRRRLRELERRLDELERRLEQDRTLGDEIDET